MRFAVLLFGFVQITWLSSYSFLLYLPPLFKGGILGIDHAGSWINLFNILSILAHST